MESLEVGIAEDGTAVECLEVSFTGDGTVVGGLNEGTGSPEKGREEGREEG